MQSTSSWILGKYTGLPFARCYATTTSCDINVLAYLLRHINRGHAHDLPGSKSALLEEHMVIISFGTMLVGAGGNAGE
eukprot:SAG11_NODE_27131_length_336_cov_1.054852_1_plen_77_part_10